MRFNKNPLKKFVCTFQNGQFPVMDHETLLEELESCNSRVTACETKFGLLDPWDDADSVLDGAQRHTLDLFLTDEYADNQWMAALRSEGIHTDDELPNDNDDTSSLVSVSSSRKRKRKKKSSSQILVDTMTRNYTDLLCTVENIHVDLNKYQWLEKTYERARFDLQDDGLEDPDFVEGDYTLGARVRRLKDALSDAWEISVCTLRRYQRAVSSGSEDVINPLPGALYRHTALSPETESKLSAYQKLLVALFQQLARKGYKRHRSWCCEQIVISETGIPTRAFRHVVEISRFVYDTCNKDRNGDMWLNMTAGPHNACNAIRHLTECVDDDFPMIEKNRHMWSFKNGILLARSWDSDLERYTCQFIPYSNSVYTTVLGAHAASCKYIDVDFPFEHIEAAIEQWEDDMTVDDDEIPFWYCIPTPNFQSVLDYQDLTPEVAAWMYVMVGRLCFDVGDMDRWQVIPYIKGVARSGKSTLLTKVVARFYESDACPVLSNNVERKFGLGPLRSGFLFIAPEIKSDMCLDQCEFQSIVTGEDVSTAIKNKDAESGPWKTPGIFSGNEIPNWKDNAGSIGRRIVAWNFSKQVTEADGNLEDKLEQELPVILYKCITAYLDYAYRYRAVGNVWNVLPKYFVDIQAEIAQGTNPLQHFLASDKVRFGHEYTCPTREFVIAFNQHCMENNLGKHRFHKDFYEGVFRSRDITEIMTATYRGRSLPRTVKAFRGIDMADNVTSVQVEPNH